MSIVEFDGPPSWSLDASETGKSRPEEYKMPQFRSHQEIKMAARRTQRSTSSISWKTGNCEQSRTFVYYSLLCGLCL